MKLCPQCDFIYEDDQSLCDMDGRELVYYPGPGPLETNSQSALTQVQENPWAAESLSVSGTVARPARSATKSAPKAEKKSEKKSKKNSGGVAGRKRIALVATAMVLGVLALMVYYISSRHTSPSASANVATPSTLSPLPESSVDTNSTAAVNSSAPELAQKASEAAAASVSDDNSVDHAKNDTSAISSSHTRNFKESSTPSESAVSADRELGANKSRAENIAAPKEASVVKHEPVIAQKESAAAKPATPVAQSRPGVVKPEDPKAKKDSKVGSFFKRAGQILKKPF